MPLKKNINKSKATGLSIMNILFLAVIIIPFFLSISSVLLGHIPFWYDPARDLLLAWDNLRKPTLIGPPTGIPGIFYGPYWIWLLSIGLMISKDPRLVVFFVLTVPYFFLLPLLLFNLARHLFDKATMMVIWLLFILSFMGYTNQIWNPHPAPLIYFGIIVTIATTQFSLFNKKMLAGVFTLGLLQGLLLNFHISFGLGIFLGTLLFFLIHCAKDLGRFNHKTKVLIEWLFRLCLYAIGVIIMFVPTLLFETRHGFNQIKALLFTLSQAVVHSQAVVGQVGLNKQQILAAFSERLTTLLQLPQGISLIGSIFVIGWVGINWWQKREDLKNSERHLLIFLMTGIIGILTVYLSSKNPVWGYHFIGIEVIFVFLLGFLLHRHQLIKKIVAIWVLLLLLLNITNSIRSLVSGPQYAGLSAEKADAESIFADANRRPFAYSAKNAAIYTYDYDYLFRWLGKKYSYTPASEINNAPLVYLIIPPELIGDKTGFVDNRTPSNRYVTVKEWQGKESVIIIRREIQRKNQ